MHVSERHPYQSVCRVHSASLVIFVVLFRQEEITVRFMDDGCFCCKLPVNLSEIYQLCVSTSIASGGVRSGECIHKSRNRFECGFCGFCLLSLAVGPFLAIVESFDILLGCIHKSQMGGM